MIVKKIRAWPAPSILAASSIEAGTVLKNPYMRNVFTPSAPPRYTMMRPMCVLRPIAGGNQSPIAVMSRKIATTPSNCGNICTTTIETSPTRRPVNRMREKEYAASAPSNVESTAVTPATMSVLANQFANGMSGLERMRV